MSKIQIYKASAGSGKTFRLTMEYLKIALADEWNYKRILGVTFTNKATTEMKFRVIEQLYDLAQNKYSAFSDELKNDLNWSDLQLSSQAKKCLKHILHDYSQFSISTIDSFFQRVIKAFSRDLGINTSYLVELDENRILDEAVDQLLLSVDDHPDLLSWLKQFALDKIREGGGWNLKNEILRLGAEIYNESFKELNDSLHEQFQNKKFLRSYQRKLRTIIDSFEKGLKDFGNRGMTMIANAGFSVSDFKYGKNGPVNSFSKLQNGELTLGTRLLNALEDPSQLYKIPDKKGLESLAMNLHPLLVEAVDFYQRGLADCQTSRLIISQLYTLGILVDLQAMVRKVCREKGIMLISESAHLLHHVIDESDSPFIYEKTGSYYENFMIDEFQDTSGIQWRNFQPLIENSLAEDHLGMLVGDVKQAIYRWRNGDWNLLQTKVQQDFRNSGSDVYTLEQNWRSAGRMIRFNNRVFQIVPAILQLAFNDEMDQAGWQDAEMREEILKIYINSSQKIGQNRIAGDGYLRMQFIEYDKNAVTEQEEQVLDEMIDQIKTLETIGISPSSIAVLVRKKDEARQVADRLLEEKNKGDQQYCFDVLSSESLYVRNAETVRFILALLHLVVTPDDMLTRTLANFQYFSFIMPRLSKLGKKAVLSPSAIDGDVQLSMDFSDPVVPDQSTQLEHVEKDANDFIQFIDSDYFRQILSSRNLQEVIFKFCELFHLLAIPEELAYMQAFIDQAAAYQQDGDSDLSGFLDWWDQTGFQKTISVSEDLDAIRIQTIHKSKGLEYDYVLIPFCDWSTEISAQHAPFIWCRPSRQPFDELDLVPVRFSKLMSESHFAKEYFTERINNYIDNLNLLYVAFTRARYGLMTWSVWKPDKLNSIGDLLHRSVVMEGEWPGETDPELYERLAQNFDEEKGILEAGQLNLIKKKEIVNGKGLELKSFNFADYSRFLKIHQNHEHYFDADSTIEEQINKGRLIHEILARIERTDQLDAAIQELLFSGMLVEDEMMSLKNELIELLNDPEVSDWFNGTYRVVNERTILTGKGGLKRPDRIMFGDNQVIVVDYKSGDEHPHKYGKQVQEYMKALKECGYQNIKGYLWYTKNNLRVEVG